MEDFVTYELAVKLKEKGFNSECHAYYEPLKHCLNLSRVFKTNALAENYNCITAPTISQVLKWLRKKKHLHIEIKIGDAWAYDIYKISSNEVFVAGIEGSLYIYTSYELAALAGIEYVLNNLI